MKNKQLGRSGIEVSAIGLGCYAIGGELFLPDGRGAAYGSVSDEESIQALHTAFELGVNFLDTADVYGAGRSEEVIGKAVNSWPGEIVIATKFGHTFDPLTKKMTGEQLLAADDIKAACEASLKRLHVEYIDLLQFHVGQLDDQETSISIRDTLETLVQEGKIRSYGWSTDDPDCAALFAKGEHCTAIQHQLNVMQGNPDTLQVCEENHLASLNRTCLGQGLLTGKFSKNSQVADNDTRALGFTGFFKDGKPVPEFIDKLAAIREILMSEGRSLAQGALCWLWARSEASIPIPGFKTVDQIKENCGSLNYAPLSKEQMSEIEQILGRS